MTDDITLLDILALVDDLEPVELLAIELQARVEQPDRDELIAATQQLVTYTDQCKNLAAKVRNLSPQPTSDVEMVWEFGL